jgi:hypothetical protein
MPCIRSYIPTSRRRRENQSVSIGLVHFTFIKRYFLVRVIASQIDYLNPSSSILLFYLMFLKPGQSALHVVSRRPRTIPLRLESRALQFRSNGFFSLISLAQVRN